MEKKTKEKKTKGKKNKGKKNKGKRQRKKIGNKGKCSIDKKEGTKKYHT